MEIKNLNKLIIAPHIDDEILGCGGIIDNNTFVLYCGMDEAHIKDSWVLQRPSAESRMGELKAAQNYLNFKYEILHNRVNRYQEIDLISSFESYINSIKPDILFIPCPSYNQDHRTVYNASLVATRPHDINFFVKKIFVYEQIQDIQWNHNGIDFKPNFYTPIDINRKKEAYSLMSSQVRGFRSPEMLEILARFRGIQSNLKYAESFEILRFVI